jgi:hypothetical protein
MLLVGLEIATAWAMLLGTAYIALHAAKLVDGVGLRLLSGSDYCDAFHRRF